MPKTDAHLGKLEMQLREWGAALDGIIAKTEAVGAEAKADYRFMADDLKAKYQIAYARLAEARSKGGDKWDTLKTGLDGAWAELEDAFAKLKADDK